MTDASASGGSPSRPASRNRNLLSVRLDGLLERSRTPSPVDPEMLRASSSAKRNSVTLLSRPVSSASLSSRAYHTQPAIDPPSLPASPSTPSFRDALPTSRTSAAEDALGPAAMMTSTATSPSDDYTDEETRLVRERTARELQEAMQTDAFVQSNTRANVRVPEPGELEGDARLQHPASKPTHSRAQSHSHSQASGSTSARMPSSLLGRPLRIAPLLDLARQTTLASSSVMNLGDYESPSAQQQQSPGLGLASLPPLPSDPSSDDFLRLSPTHGPQYASRPPYSGTIKSNSPTLLRQHEPSRTTSVDTLRSIQNAVAQRRALSSSAPSEGSGGGGALWGSGSSGWWFQHKNDVEPLLDDRDKEDANESAEDKLRKRCKCSLPHWTFCSCLFASSPNRYPTERSGRISPRTARLRLRLRRHRRYLVLAGDTRGARGNWLRSTHCQSARDEQYRRTRDGPRVYYCEGTPGAEGSFDRTQHGIFTFLAVFLLLSFIIPRTD